MRPMETIFRSSTSKIDLGNGAVLTLWNDFLRDEAADALFGALLNQIEWQRPRVNVFGREHPIPRLQYWMGDPDAKYRYSGLLLMPQEWHPSVQILREQISAACQRTFNATLINLYRDGADKMGWHSDDEAELGDSPWIASFNLGSERTFALRKQGKTRTEEQIELKHNQLLLMSPAVQQGWQHCVPQRKRITQPRINMTFRRILS